MFLPYGRGMLLLTVVLAPLRFGVAAETSFYPGSDFMKRTGVLESGDGVRFMSSLYPFPGPGDSILVFLATQFENRALLFEKEGGHMEADLELSVSLRNAERQFLLTRTWEEHPVAPSGDRAISDEKGIVQIDMTTPPGVISVTHEIRDRNAERTGSVGPAEISVQPPADQPWFLGPYPVYVKLDSPLSSGQRPGLGLDSLLFNPGRMFGFGRDGIGFLIACSRSETGPVEPLSLTAHLAFEDADPEELGEPVELTFPGQSSVKLVVPASRVDQGIAEISVVITDLHGRVLDRLSAPFFVSLTEEWFLSEYEEAVAYLEHLITSREKSKLEDAPPEQRKKLWREFWEERDPVPATPENELLEEYFRRIQVADIRYTTSLMEGWKTDMGRVFVLLGQPDTIQRVDQGQRLERIEIWSYWESLGFQLNLYFVDRGFTGLYWLENEWDLQNALSRLRGG